jgi:hypothetical protein
MKRTVFGDQGKQRGTTTALVYPRAALQGAGQPKLIEDHFAIAKGHVIRAQRDVDTRR